MESTRSKPPEADRDNAELAARLRLVLMRLTRRLRREAATELSPSVASALASLEHKGPLTLSELAALEGVKPPSVTRMAASLERQGLVRRDRDPADARVSRISISSDGRRSLQRSRTRKTAYLAKRLGTLDDADAAAVADALTALERLLEIER